MTDPNPAPPAEGLREKLVTEAARAALLHVEHARTDVVNPVNGSAPYSFVFFHGQRIEFHDNPCANSFERDAGSGRAAAYAQKINDGLFELAKAAARNAVSSLTVENERLREALEAFVRFESGIMTDIQTAHHRGQGASSAMREDDRDMRADLRHMFAVARAALSSLPAMKGEG